MRQPRCAGACTTRYTPNSYPQPNPHPSPNPHQVRRGLDDSLHTAYKLLRTKQQRAKLEALHPAGGEAEDGAAPVAAQQIGAEDKAQVGTEAEAVVEEAEAVTEAEAQAMMAAKAKVKAVEARAGVEAAAA